MVDRIDCLACFTDLVAGGRTDQFDDTVKLAYHAGASREDQLTAMEVGRVLANVPDPVVVRTYASIHDWNWIAPGRADYTLQCVSQPA